jgi:hypothetical protein
MERLTETVAGAVRHRVVTAAPGTFLRRKDFAGPDRAVESALSRLTAADELVRVRRGLYWRGKTTRFGMTAPSLLEAAIAVAGVGSGPAGVAAAHLLGLTTQVPGTIEIAAPGKVPEPLQGVRFRSRSFTRREQRLSPTEVAVLEVLRDPAAAEVSWSVVEQRIGGLIASGKVRAGKLGAEVADEHHREARRRWVALPSAA